MTENTTISVELSVDIGTHNVVGVMAQIYPGDGPFLEIIKVVSRPSRGIKRGIITNIVPITNIVQDMIADFEREENVNVWSVSTSISGAHIRSRSNNGVVTISGERFTEKDQARILSEAGKLKLDVGERVLHVLPQKYIVDGGPPVENALGLAGVKFTLMSHLVTAATNEMANITNCITTERSTKVDNIIYEGIAAAIAVLSEDEKQRGVTVIDIGAGVTDVVVYQAGVVVYHASLSIGGDDVTSDIAKVKRFSTQVSESIKIEYGSCMGYTSFDDIFTLPVITNQTESRTMSRRELASIIEARYREIFDFVRAKIEEVGVYQHHDAGVVLTGGASMITGCTDLVQDIMEKPCRLGVPLNHVRGGGEGLTPAHAAAIGLLAARVDKTIWQKEMQKTMPKGNFFSKMYKKITENF